MVNFPKLVKTQFEKWIKIIRSDNGTEFTSNRARQYYLDFDIIHQTFCVNTPQQNRKAKTKHGHILNVARALMIQASLSIKFYFE